VAGHTFTHQATSPATSTQAWDALQRPETWGAIGGVKRIEDSETDPEGHLLGYRFVVEVGGSEHHGRARRLEADPPRHMVMGISSDHLEGEIGVEVTSSEASTLISVTMSMRPAGFLASLFFPAVARTVESGFDDHVERFARSLAAS
jgi:carbon monoxide dehydrogenase subunit G